MPNAILWVLVGVGLVVLAWLTGMGVATWRQRKRLEARSADEPQT